MKKTALITGSAKGLGAELATTLQSEGYDIIIHYLSSEKEAKDVVNAKQVIKADLTKKNEVEKMFKSIGPVDILINNIGDFIYSPLLDTSVDDFEYCIQNNFLSAWYCIKNALPHMQKQNFGRIINFGCVSCDQLTSRPNTTPYYIAKTSLLMLTRSLAKELKDTNITVNMISPGVLPTGYSANNPEIPTVPFDAITRSMLFLISNENNNIRGANLEVSAGWRPS